MDSKGVHPKFNKAKKLFNFCGLKSEQKTYPGLLKSQSYCVLNKLFRIILLGQKMCQEDTIKSCSPSYELDMEQSSFFITKRKLLFQIQCHSFIIVSNPTTARKWVKQVALLPGFCGVPCAFARSSGNRLANNPSLKYTRTHWWVWNIQASVKSLTVCYHMMQTMAVKLRNVKCGNLSKYNCSDCYWLRYWAVARYKCQRLLPSWTNRRPLSNIAASNSAYNFIGY